MGPRGTVTALHHDQTNILFHQIYGRKQFLLVPPDASAPFDGARGFYAGDQDPERLDAKRRRAWRSVPVARVVLEPGEALFLPVGWWHQVRSLDVSISLSLMCFRRPNVFHFYKPAFRTAP